MEVQSLLVAEVVGGAKTTAKKSVVKNLGHLWEDVSTVQYTTWSTLDRSDNLLFQTESWTGGSVHQLTAETGPEPDNPGHAGNVFRLLHCSERKSYDREAQGECFFFFF